MNRSMTVIPFAAGLLLVAGCSLRSTTADSSEFDTPMFDGMGSHHRIVTTSSSVIGRHIAALAGPLLPEDRYRMIERRAMIAAAAPGGGREARRDDESGGPESVGGGPRPLLRDRGSCRGSKAADRCG